MAFRGCAYGITKHGINIQIPIDTVKPIISRIYVVKIFLNGFLFIFNRYT